MLQWIRSILYVIQATVAIIRGERDSLIVSHEAEEAVENVANSDKANAPRVPQMKKSTP